eukprot:scaffold1445_cov235-Pinguiococcus_pyrenoidosus.AAC.5
MQKVEKRCSDATRRLCPRSLIILSIHELRACFYVLKVIKTLHVQSPILLSWAAPFFCFASMLLALSLDVSYILASVQEFSQNDSKNVRIFQKLVDYIDDGIKNIWNTLNSAFSQTRYLTDQDRQDAIKKMMSEQRKVASTRRRFAYTTRLVTMESFGHLSRIMNTFMQTNLREAMLNTGVGPEKISFDRVREIYGGAATIAIAQPVALKGTGDAYEDAKDHLSFIERLADDDVTSVLNRRIQQDIEENPEKNEGDFISDVKIVELLTCPCFFCGQEQEIDEDFKISCIGRIDTEEGLTDENSIPCCKACIVGKGIMSARDFIKSCHFVSSNRQKQDGDEVTFSQPTSNRDFAEVYKTYTNKHNRRPCRAVDFTMYKANAKQRHIQWNLTENEFNMLTKKECFYYGRQGSNICGVDRIDSDGSYDLDNVVPACSCCNRMKSYFPGFIDRCKRVATIHELKLMFFVYVLSFASLH